MSWKLVPSHQDNHPTIIESTTGTIACGDSWCDGRCGLPALTLDAEGKELRAFGSMVACGSIFQRFRIPWTGTKVPITLDEPISLKTLLKRFWM